MRPALATSLGTRREEDDRKRRSEVDKGEEGEKEEESDGEAMIGSAAVRVTEE